MTRRTAVVAAPVGLDRGTLTGRGLFFFSVSASAPMTAVAGGIVAAFAVSGLVGVPAFFAVVTVALGLFSVGYVSMARYVPHAGPLYAHVARGLGPVAGMSAAVVALVSYGSIQFCLFGLLGASLVSLLGGVWWGWALAAWAVVALLGVVHVAFNAAVLAVALVIEVVAVALFDAGALLHPAGGHVDLSPLWRLDFTAGRAGGAVALCVACFMGYETALAFGEEARSHAAIARATFGSLLFLGGLYTVSAWAVTAATGPDRVGSASTDTVFGVIGAHAGVAVMGFANWFLITSIVAAMVSFHQTVARYLYVLTREQLLPARFGRIRHGSGVPVGGSLVGSVIGLVVLVAWIVLDGDPLSMFTQLAALAGIGIMTLMASCCVAVMVFYHRGGGVNENAWTRVLAPLLGAAAMAVLVVLTVVNLSSVTGADPGSAAVWLIPAVLAVAALAGMGWALIVRSRHPAVAAGVGIGEREPLAELEHHFADVHI